MDAVERLIRGSIDMHVHHGPDAHIARSVDAFEATAQAEAAGMGAIVLKSHDYSTAPIAGILKQRFPKVTVVGSLCLDFGVGGLNPAAVEVSAALGARMVWMPTFSAAYDMKKRGIGPGGISITDEQGSILPVVTDILGVIKHHDMVVASGHVGFDEIVALVNACRRLGIARTVITHALEPRFGATLTVAQQERLAGEGATIEHTYLSALPSGGGIGLKAIVDAVKAVGAGHCILSTDLGQRENPTPADGMKTAIKSLLDAGLDEGEITMMLKTNPARLLGIT